MSLGDTQASHATEGDASISVSIDIFMHSLDACPSTTNDVYEFVFGADPEGCSVKTSHAMRWLE
jgi:hypothetical protein